MGKLVEAACRVLFISENFRVRYHKEEIQPAKKKKKNELNKCSHFGEEDGNTCHQLPTDNAIHALHEQDPDLISSKMCKNGTYQITWYYR